MRTIQFYYRKDKNKTSLMITEICLGTRRSLGTVYKWMNGERVPCHLEQLFIQKVVKKHYSEDVPLEELFAGGKAEED